MNRNHIIIHDLGLWFWPVLRKNRTDKIELNLQTKHDASNGRSILVANLGKNVKNTSTRVAYKKVAYKIKLALLEILTGE